jgi:drug/metabolite transporter (DMT)-like permease
MLQSLIVIGSEITLALYPILIKVVPTTLVTQILSRFIVYTVLGAVFTTTVGGGLSQVTQTLFSQAGLQRSLVISSLNLTHVYTSYTAFTELSAGSAMALFYTYPIWILLFSALFYGESFTPAHVALIALAFLGTLLVAQDTKEKEGFQDAPTNWKGVLAALAAALTEAGIYFAVKSSEHSNPFVAVLELYALGLAGLLAYIGIQKEAIDTRMSSWTPLVLFNVIIGFIGYCLRFYAIPRVPTAIFSILSFVGVIASFSWGRIFVKEIPTVKTVIGAGLISVAAAASVFTQS